MASIPNEFIEDLLNRIDIKDVVESRVNLKKAGRDYSGLCPFHAENTPSFTVSQQKQFYHCFGCGKNGSAIGFIMDYEGLDFVDAVKELALTVGLSVPMSAHSGPKQKHNNLYAITEKTTRIFQHQMTQNPQVMTYVSDRGISQDMIDRFQLGYAQNQWDALLKRFGEHEQPLLDQVGLTTENDRGRRYDKFRNRLMFPIHDRRGRVIAFGGRAVETDQKPKYLNSPETPLFHKSQELYAYHLARKHSKSDQVLVVEGYMDVVALHQHGIENVVATLGTATTPQHLQLLFKTWDHIVFCFDGDQAGRQAAQKALMTALPLYLDNKIIHFLFLPQGEDPDSYVNQNGPEAFKQQLDQAMPLSEFLIKVISQGVDSQSLDGRAQLANKAVPFLDQLPKGTFKAMMKSKIEQLTRTRLGQNIRTKTQKNNAEEGPNNPVRRMLSLLLNSPQLCARIPDDLNLTILSFKGVEIIDKIVEIYSLNPQINSAAMVEHFRDTRYAGHLGRLMRLYDHLDHGQQALEFDDLMDHLHKLASRYQIDQLREKQLQGGLSNEEKLRLVQLLSQKAN